MFLFRAYSFTRALNSLWSSTSPQYSSTKVFLAKQRGNNSTSCLGALWKTYIHVKIMDLIKYNWINLVSYKIYIKYLASNWGFLLPNIFQKMLIIRHFYIYTYYQNMYSWFNQILKQTLKSGLWSWKQWFTAEKQLWGNQDALKY